MLSGSGGGSGSQRFSEGEPTTATVGIVLLGFLHKDFCVQIISNSCVYVVVIDHMFHVDKNFQQSLVARKFLEDEEATAIRRKCTAQFLNLGVALCFNLHVDKTIFGAMCGLQMSLG